jgi:hypothetical protein
MRMLGTSACSAVAAAVTTGLVQVVDGQPIASATAYVVVFAAATGAALLAGGIAAATPRPAPLAAPEPAAV